MYRKSVLDNGVRIVTEAVPQVRTASVGIWVNVGSRDEAAANSGCSHFVEHMFFKGTALRSAARIARELDVLGGNANAFTTRENTCLYATVLDDHLQDLLEILADLLLGSTFAPEEVERERRVILQEFHLVEDTPDDQIHDLFAGLLWGDHPLGRTVLGSREVVGSMTQTALREHVSRFYRPERLVVAAAGRVEHEELVRFWRTALEKLEPLPAPPREAPFPVPPVRRVFAKELEQVHAVAGTYGLACDHEERYALFLLHTILGGNMSSRLFQEIREKRGLAYSVYSDLSVYGDSGALSVYLGVEATALNETLHCLRLIVRQLGEEPVSEAELAHAKEYARAGLYLAAENMESCMMRLARNELCFGRFFSLAEVAEAIRRITAQEITSVCRRLLGDGSGLALAALGPLAAADVDEEIFR